MPGRATHLPKEVGHHHVWKGLGPSRDLGGWKQWDQEEGIHSSETRLAKPLDPRDAQHAGLRMPHQGELGYLSPVTYET